MLPVPDLDRLIVAFDNGLRTLMAPARSARPHPDAAVDDVELSAEQRALSAALMRVNHTGEICAQALYQGLCHGPESRPNFHHGLARLRCDGLHDRVDHADVA